MSVPYIDPAILEWLRRTFRGKMPANTLPHTDYVFRSGQESVVQLIETQVTKQDKDLSAY
jgi:hypothetical protein